MHIRSVARACAVLLVAALCECVSAANVTAEEQCLSAAFTKRHYALRESSADVERLGCYATNGVARELFRYNTSAGITSDVVIQCATFCQLRDATSRKAQFTLENGVCGCIPRGSYIYPDSAYNNTGCCYPQTPFTYCPPTLAYAAVYELELLCPLNITLCVNLKYCRSSGACCFPIEDGSTEKTTSEASSMLLAQWAGGFLIIAGVGHASYLIALRRHRRLAALAQGDEPLLLRERHERRLVLPGTAPNDDSIVLIGLLDLPGVAGRCVGLFDKCEQLGEDASCTICLEDYDGAADVVETPCKHVFHRACLVDFVQHRLRGSLDDVSCPMCRAAIIEQVIEEDSELGRLRRTLIDMRQGPPPAARPPAPRPRQTVAAPDSPPSSAADERSDAEEADRDFVLDERAFAERRGSDATPPRQDSQTAGGMLHVPEASASATTSPGDRRRTQPTAAAPSPSSSRGRPHSPPRPRRSAVVVDDDDNGLELDAIAPAVVERRLSLSVLTPAAAPAAPPATPPLSDEAERLMEAEL